MMTDQQLLGVLREARDTCHTLGTALHAAVVSLEARQVVERISEESSGLESSGWTEMLRHTDRMQVSKFNSEDEPEVLRLTLKANAAPSSAETRQNLTWFRAFFNAAKKLRKRK